VEKKMTNRAFIQHDETTAPAASRPRMAAVRQQFGLLPSPIARLAAAPAVLDAALTGLAQFEASSLAPLEREVLAMTLGQHNGCHYCINLHRRLLRLHEAPKELIDALETGAPLAVPRLETLRRFVLELLARTGDPSSESWSEFLAAGFDRVQALEIVQGIAAYTLTTFANRLTEAPLDG